jgi:hypothetical protein
LDTGSYYALVSVRSKTVAAHRGRSSVTDETVIHLQFGEVDIMMNMNMVPFVIAALTEVVREVDAEEAALKAKQEDL